MQTPKKDETLFKKSHLKLSDALFRLLLRQSFEEITVVDICKSADVPRATFYNHFEDKYDLLRCGFRIRLQGFDKELTGYRYGTKEYFTRLIDVIMEYLKKNKETLLKIFRLDKSAGLVELQTVLCNEFKKRLSEAVSQGNKFPLPIEPMAEFYGGAMIFFIKWYLDHAGQLSRSDLVEFLSILAAPHTL